MFYATRTLYAKTLCSLIYMFIDSYATLRYATLPTLQRYKQVHRRRYLRRRSSRSTVFQLMKPKRSRSSSRNKTQRVQYIWKRRVWIGALVVSTAHQWSHVVPTPSHPSIYYTTLHHITTHRQYTTRKPTATTKSSDQDDE